jgi:phenylalanyl-tRNA synthetase alpha chain
VEEQIRQLRSDARQALAALADQKELEALRVRLLGRKGSVTLLRQQIPGLPAQERPGIGRMLNDLQAELASALEEAARALAASAEASRLRDEEIDITLPGREPRLGRPHPITQTIARIREVFTLLGFEEVEGPEVETEYYNFDALNTPAHHPSRDMHDTFYVSDALLLRTHTSPVQVRVMEQRRPPIRILCPGRVYRRDADVSRSPMFHQVEGLLVDRDVRFSDLKGVLAEFARQMFGSATRVRFRPSFFPFTEPSAEVDVSCFICGGEGCRVCKSTGWVEILGAGSVDPEVFRAVGYDPEVYRGFAFGMGPDRIAMSLFGINDIRFLFENDMRLLSQF